MTWRFTDDAAAHLAAVGPLLTRDPVLHTLPLTLLEAARASTSSPPTTYGSWTGRHGVSGAVSWTDPYGLLLATVPSEAVRPLVDALLGLTDPPDSLSGPTALVAEVAAVWTARTGGRAVLHHAERLHRLVDLAPPSPPPAGAARRAGPADTGLLEGWLSAFADEAGVPRGDVPALVADRLAYGGLVLWEAGGRPVSLAAASRRAAGIVRVGPVYTPPQERARGYGAGVTAEVARRALAEGAAGVVLFTDLANPTSNALYRRLGFRAVGDRLVVRVDGRAT